MSENKEEGKIIRYQPSVREVRELVRITGIGLFDAHKILIKAYGNMTKAIEMVRTINQALTTRGKV